MTLNNFVFFDSSSTGSESNVMEVLERSEDMTLHVTGNGSVSLKVMGMADLQDGNWETIAAISLESFGVSQSITSNGIYCVPLRGLTRLKIVNSGSSGVKVYGRIMA